ncbi:MAG TPA: hypothetical protein VML54_03925, partial [Candidatus Limnocylindrales bacterium]|nr:hypothetical protein [Candidatus Limnocylindrales bacterium]
AARGHRAPRGLSPVTAARPAAHRHAALRRIRFDAALCRNRQSFPRDHPSAVRDCLFAYGFDIGTPAAGDQTEFFESAVGALRAVTDEAGASLIPVWTNLRHLDPDGRAWPTEWYGLAAASIAHALAPRLSRVLLAGGLDVGRLMPAGGHPMLDPYFGSAGLQVVHDGAHLSRVEKMRLVADWDVAIQNVRVCWAGIQTGGPFNCGRCHKCLLTMMGLVALSRLDRALSFPVREVTPAMLGDLRLDNPYLPTFYRELIAPLEAVGRRDLTRVIEAKIREHDRAAMSADDGAQRLARSFGRALGRLARHFT